MKIVGINGSPRKNWNTGTLLKKALEGAESENIGTELINIYDLDYSGCNSCFYCKKKDIEHGHCNMNDDLSPILEDLRTVNGIIFGSPVYFANVSSGMIAFLERFLFSNMLYTETPSVFPKNISSGFIYTMNAPEEAMKIFNLEDGLKTYQNSIETMLGERPEILYVNNTLQFNDYSKYEASMFSEEDKTQYKKEHFPIDCEKAFNLGVKIAKSS